MASSYKWPLIVLFTAATIFSIWTGKQLALRRAAARDPLVVDPNANVEQSGNAVQTQLNPDNQAGRNPGTNAGQSPSRELAESENRAIAVEECTISMAQVNDPRPPLSIREQPSPQSAVVGEVNNEQFIDISGSQGDWFLVTSPVRGWVPRDLTNYACNQKVARVEFPRGQRSTDLEGNFVGTGTHRYKLRASRNQSITLDSEVGPMPRLIGPDEGILFSGPDEGDPDTWTGALPREGDYILELDSNFRGYAYRFNVQIQ